MPRGGGIRTLRLGIRLFREVERASFYHITSFAPESVSIYVPYVSYLGATQANKLNALVSVEG